MKHWMARHIPNEVEDSILVPEKLITEFLGSFKAESKTQECFYTGAAAVGSFHNFGYIQPAAHFPLYAFTWMLQYTTIGYVRKNYNYF